MLDAKSLAMFKQLYLQEYGVELSETESYERATNLVNLYRAVYLPKLVVETRGQNET